MLGEMIGLLLFFGIVALIAWIFGGDTDYPEYRNELNVDEWIALGDTDEWEWVNDSIKFNS